MELTILGPRNKPSLCVNCPNHGAPNSTGFVGDYIPPQAKFLLVKYQPLVREINYRHNDPTFFDPYIIGLGISSEDFGIVNIVRCRESGKKSIEETLKVTKLCRKYDDLCASEDGKVGTGGLVTFNPDMALITFDVVKAEQTSAMKIFLRKAFEWAVEYANKGFKPLILSGLEASRTVFPDLFSNQDSKDRETSFRNWIGHWAPTSWPISKDTEIWKKGERENRNLFEIEKAERERLGWIV